MALNPNIALAGTPPPPPQSPLEMMAQVQQIKALKGEQQLRQAQLSGINLENQQRQRDLADDDTFRKLYTDSITKGTQLSDDQIMQTLGPTKGSAFMKSRLEATQTRAQLQKLRDEHTQVEADYAGSLAYGLLQTKDSKTGLIDPMAVGAAAKQAHNDGYEQESQLLQQAATQNPKGLPDLLTQLVQKSPRQRQLASSEDRAQASEDRARAAEQNSLTQAQRADQAAKNATATEERWRREDAERERHDQATERIGQQNAQSNQTRAEKVSASSTVQAGVQARFDENMQRKDRVALDSINNQRVLIGNALAAQNGDQYPDPANKGKLSSAEMNDTIRNGLAKQLQNLTSQGVGLMKRNDWPNEFQDALGQKTYGSAPAAAPAAPPQQQSQKPAQQPNTQQVLPKDPTGRSKYTIGQTLYKSDGTSIKVKGFTKDGKIVPQ